MNRLAVIAHVVAVFHRVELRRHREHPQLGAAVLVWIGFGTLFVVGSLPSLEALWPEPGAYHYGTLVADEPGTVLDLARSIGAIAVVVSAALAGIRATTRSAWETPPVELVTAVSLPTAIVGVFGDELAESGWFVGPVALAGVLAFATGTESALTLVGSVVGASAILATGLAGGAAAGVGFRASIRHSPRLYRWRYGLGIVGLFVTFFTLTVSRTAGDALARTPLGWFGDLVLLTTPGADASPLAALGALAVTAVVVALSLALALRAGRALWFAEDRLERESTATQTGESGACDTAPADRTGWHASRSRVDVAVERALSRPTAAVTRSIWRRTRRSPRVLVFVVFPFAIVGPVTADAGVRWPALVPVLVVLYAAAAVGLGTTLNLLGNERRGLPTILTTPVGRRSVCRGYAVAALVPGIPFAVVAGLAVGVLLGLEPGEFLAIALIALALTVGGVGVSLGIGSFFPNLEGVTAGTLSPPKLYATAAYLLAMSVLATPAFVGFAPERLTGAPSGGLALTVGLTTVVAAVAGVAGYRYARRTLETHELGGA